MFATIATRIALIDGKRMAGAIMVMIAEFIADTNLDRVRQRRRSTTQDTTDGLFCA